MQLGDTGPGVKELKMDLDRWGENPGVIDDEFTKKTQEAVRAVQRKLGLEDTGIVDQTFSDAVEKDLSSQEPKLRDKLSLDSSSSNVIPFDPSRRKSIDLAVRSRDVELAGLPNFSPLLWIVLGGTVIWLLLRKSSEVPIDVEKYEGDDSDLEGEDLPSEKIGKDLESIKSEMKKRTKKKDRSTKKEPTGDVIDAEIIEKVEN